MQDYCHIHRCLMSKNDEKKMREKRKNSKENPIFIPRFSLSFFISIDGKNKRYLFNLRIFSLHHLFLLPVETTTRTNIVMLIHIPLELFTKNIETSTRVHTYKCVSFYND